jgi:hypothetical protein
VDGDIPATITVTVGLANQLAWLRANAQSNGAYLVEVGADESIVMHHLSFSGRNNIEVTIRGIGQNRIVSLSPAEPSNEMFFIPSGVTLILDNNITLQGREANRELITVLSNGTFKMNTGSTITHGGVSVSGTFDMNGGNISGSTNTGVSIFGNGIFNMSEGTISGNSFGVFMSAGILDMKGGSISGNSSRGVFVDGGIFNMSGGNLFGNTASSGGGVSVSGGGTFNMSGGIISGNTASSAGGGVSVSGDGTFYMSGGTISGNTASIFGGGVSIQGILNKTGGTITGYTSDTINGNVVRSNTGVVLNNSGHAVSGFNNQSNVEKRKETTAGPGVNLSYNGLTGAWSGNWDF